MVRAARRPSSVCVGGIRMSTTATSGCSRSTSRRRPLPRRRPRPPRRRRRRSAVAQGRSERASRHRRSPRARDHRRRPACRSASTVNRPPSAPTRSAALPGRRTPGRARRRRPRPAASARRRRRSPARGRPPPPAGDRRQRGADGGIDRHGGVDRDVVPHVHVQAGGVAPVTRSSSAGQSPSSVRTAGKTPCARARGQVQRLVDLGLGAGEALGHHRAGVPHGELEVEGDADQPLLNAVVEVALDPAALGVPHVDDPALGGLHLDEARPADRREAGVHQGESRGRGEAIRRVVPPTGQVEAQGGPDPSAQVDDRRRTGGSVASCPGRRPSGPPPGRRRPPHGFRRPRRGWPRGPTSRSRVARWRAGRGPRRGRGQHRAADQQPASVCRPGSASGRSALAQCASGADATAASTPSASAKATTTVRDARDRGSVAAATASTPRVITAAIARRRGSTRPPPGPGHVPAADGARRVSERIVAERDDRDRSRDGPEDHPQDVPRPLFRPGGDHDSTTGPPRPPSSERRRAGSRPPSRAIPSTPPTRGAATRPRAAPALWRHAHAWRPRSRPRPRRRARPRRRQGAGWWIPSRAGKSHLPLR